MRNARIQETNTETPPNMVIMSRMISFVGGGQIRHGLLGIQGVENIKNGNPQYQCHEIDSIVLQALSDILDRKLK